MKRIERKILKLSFPNEFQKGLKLQHNTSKQRQFTGLTKMTQRLHGLTYSPQSSWKKRNLLTPGRWLKRSWKGLSSWHCAAGLAEEGTTRWHWTGGSLFIWAVTAILFFLSFFCFFLTFHSMNHLPRRFSCRMGHFSSNQDARLTSLDHFQKHFFLKVIK